MPTPAFFVYFRFFHTQILQKKLYVSRIRTRIIGVEWKHADHLTTTTAHLELCFNFDAKLISCVIDSLIAA